MVEIILIMAVVAATAIQLTSRGCKIYFHEYIEMEGYAERVRICRRVQRKAAICNNIFTSILYILLLYSAVVNKNENESKLKVSSKTFYL